jgi:phosphoribosylformimino-5-aminoimidazole carboxamide ribotide isomerase
MIEIIPAIDIIEGKCVRLSQGDYTQQIIYNEDPLQVAKEFENAGIRRLHIVDLDGAKQGKIVNQKVLEKIASNTKLIIDFGGGVKTSEDIESVFNSGAAIVTIGSVAVKEPELFHSWIKKFGPNKILLGADAKNEKLCINGWLETTELSLFDFIESNIQNGISKIFCTDISKDGLLQGPSVDIYKKIMDRFPKIELIASGGVSNIEDVYELEKIGCKGVIIGKAIYEGKINLKKLAELC